MLEGELQDATCRLVGDKRRKSTQTRIVTDDFRGLELRLSSTRGKLLEQLAEQRWRRTVDRKRGVRGHRAAGVRRIWQDDAVEQPSRTRRTQRLLIERPQCRCGRSH